MQKPRATSWRNWTRAGGLAGLVAAATALAPASELENVGYALRPGQSDIQDQIDATLPIGDEADLGTAADTSDRPMYRLPAIEEMSAPAPVVLPSITPLTQPTEEPTVEPTETEPAAEPIEAEPPATLPTITILPPVESPPDMTLEEVPADDVDSERAASEDTDFQPEEQEPNAPTITILPPVDVISEEVQPEVEEVEPTEPTITILPPVDEPTMLHAEQSPPAEPETGITEETQITEEGITEEFDAAWNEGNPNEGNPPEAARQSPALPPLPIRLPTIPPLVEEPTEPFAAPRMPITEPVPQMAETLPPMTEPVPPMAETLPPMVEPMNAPPAQIARQATVTPLHVAPPQITPYTPTTAELSRQLLPTVQKAYRLAQQGAVYAAQAEFIRVLRRIAEAKDSASGVDRHSRALAAGLRAIDEADDFAPSGTALEADVNVAQIASAHRTPVLPSETPSANRVRPAVAVALYHEFARAQLATAVAGEQAGSMALHGLGKVHLRLARGNDSQLQHERTALAMFAAALDAAPGNHLAANEIGVLLSRAGYPAEASMMFRHAIDLAPTSTAYHNLAMTDQALGYHEQAAANERYAFELAQRDRAASAASRSRGVAWVAPQELSRMAQPMPIEMNQQRMAGSPPPNMIQPVGGQARGGVETASKWPKKLIPGSFWR